MTRDVIIWHFANVCNDSKDSEVNSILNKLTGLNEGCGDLQELHVANSVEEMTTGI